MANRIINASVLALLLGSSQAAGYGQATVNYSKEFPLTSLKAESEMKLVQKMYGEASMVCNFFGMMDCNMALKRTGKTNAQILAEKKACSVSSGCAPPRNAKLL